ncbi:MAG: hypothetical protein NC394_05810 [Bacteroides sp.]|nr:hypothetical protein [Bacteroides sp.]
MLIDYTDLAVCVKADSLGGRIDPDLYLDCGDDYDKMNFKRFCLALGIEEEYLRNKTAEEYRKIFMSECIERFHCAADRDPLSLAVILSSLFDYTEQGINGSYFIDHDSGER